jgi:hypothetical protein
VSVRLAPGGTTRLGEAEVQALVADFRGW